MTRNSASARRWMRRAVASILATLACGGVFAQSENPALNEEGFFAGRMIVAPALTFGYSYDTNVLQQPENTQPPPEPDEVLTVQPTLQLTIPFGNSAFRFGDTLRYVDYQHTPQTQGKASNDAMAALTLNFGSRDQLEINAHNIAGVAETIEFDPGGEIGFQGNKFQLHAESVLLARVLGALRGYRFYLARHALRFDPGIEVNFYNYRGFEGEASFFQPLSPNTRIAFGYVGSRYEHSDASTPSVVNRHEDGDMIYGQVEGQLGPRQPYNARLGWERLAFEGTDAQTSSGDFSGIVGNVSLSAIVGGGTVFTVEVQRQPYRSYDQTNSFYVFNLVSGTVEREFRPGTSVGGGVGLSVNGYKQLSTYRFDDNGDGDFLDPGETVQNYRDDRRVQLEAHANIALARNVAFRISLERNRRYSNAPRRIFDYNNTVLFGGFVLGWS